MAKKTKSNGVNKSAAIREVFKQNPKIKAKEVVAILETQGIKVTTALVYMVKGSVHGAKKQRRKNRKNAAVLAQATGGSDAIIMLQKVKSLANEVGGLDILKELVEVLRT